MATATETALARRHHAVHRQHAAGAAAPRDRGLRGHRGWASWRTSIRCGASRTASAVAMIDAAERDGKIKPGHGHHRADQRQHGHRPGLRLRRPRLQADGHHAREHEPRAAAAAEGAGGRDGADAGRRRHARRGPQGRGAGRPNNATTSCRSSSRTRPTRRSTARPRPRKSGATPTARSTSSSPASAPAARSPAWARCSRRASRAFKIDRRRAGQQPGHHPDAGRPGAQARQAHDPGHRRRLHSRRAEPRRSSTRWCRSRDDDAMETARQLAKLRRPDVRHQLRRRGLGGARKSAKRPRERRQADRRHPARPRRALPVDEAVSGVRGRASCPPALGGVSCGHRIGGGAGGSLGWFVGARRAPYDPLRKEAFMATLRRLMSHSRWRWAIGALLCLTVFAIGAGFALLRPQPDAKRAGPLATNPNLVRE